VSSCGERAGFVTCRDMPPHTAHFDELNDLHDLTITARGARRSNTQGHGVTL
jgi:hypothetical protein